jgi:hypothetical protein
LQEPATTWHFRAWIEEWENDVRLKNDVVAEVRILEKYKNLVFYDPDEKCNYTISDKNLQFIKKRGDKGWYLIGVPHDSRLEEESFTLELAIELILKTKQADGVLIISPATEDAEVEAVAEVLEDGDDGQEESC